MTPVDREGLAGVHGLVRRLLGELDRVATAHDVPFHLAYGTAIGAARDGDLIPWDVDADVWVRREHYARLVDVLAGALGPEFELLTPETHPDYEYLFPRLVLRGIHHVYVRVDVFPLDPAPRWQPAAVALTAWRSGPAGADDIGRHSCEQNGRAFINTERFYL